MRMLAAARSRPSRVCVIGAGANGLAVLQVFADSPHIQSGDWSIVCFEDREDVGGVWRPAAPSSDNKPPVSAVYDSLKINLPHPIMTYQTYPFPPETPLFPTAARLLRYLEDYTEHFGLRRFIRFETLVTATRWSKEDAVWKVSLSTGETLDFDALIVSNGHYRRPRYPEVPGLQSWLASGRVMHSAWYRRPAQLSSYNKILVAGGGLSANDVCADLVAVGKHVLHSIPSAPGEYPPDSDLYRKVPRVTRYGDNGEILFQDGSIELGVDFVVLAVGYECSYPFFSEPDIVDGFPDIPPPFPKHLYNTTYGLFPLAKHIFPLQSDYPAHSVAFPGLAIKVAIFPIFEDQARAILHVLEDPSRLDIAAESTAIIERSQRIAKALGTDDPDVVIKEWIFFTLWEGFEYRAELSKFVNPHGPWTVPEWEAWMWERKGELRSVWLDIEKRGEATKWLKGVGSHGVGDWFAFCKRLLQKEAESPAAKL
ncbi:FAD/NAD(P)-binding domain-containing protein [Peniophora sp. CONT]|nr:FAD/NAD(P)-binding domain-containing protein [Peniophora sp. CONT]